ncbi:nudix family hydrolase-like protein [Calycina marina]|uniref:Nudix family hydrolase-like protein n=1 Tax=Calycina marina TaxID=1763456 RepID=A0A9P7Z5Q8_9HELO|nr:nudix family hydrolase-like protein [Calycina marina]
MMAESSLDEASQKLIDSLHQTLTFLLGNPYPTIPNPPSCKKRASVALILRIRPSFTHPQPPNALLSDLTTSRSPSAQLSAFFSQSWVRLGSPECVFIKRSARVGDRWTSHVALPGGKRDPEDANDRETAIRETAEEVGLDLTDGSVICVGNLPERVVSTSWGKVPIMVLCPYVFIYTNADVPPVKLQPTEVASTHWVPLRVLLSPSSRTYEYVDVSDRFARQGGIATKALLRSVLWKMRFSAIRLIPSESVYCSSTAEFFPPQEFQPANQLSSSVASKLYSWYLGDNAASADKERPLLLWGLTLGVLADFLDQLPPHNAVTLWSYPTFTTWDARFIIHILTLRLKKHNTSKLRRANQTAIDSEAVAIAARRDNPWFIGGLSEGPKDGKGKGKGEGERKYAVGVMLEGYYDMARRGVWLAILGRTVAGLAVIAWVVRWYKRKT